MKTPTDTRSAPLKLAVGMGISGTVGAFGVESGLDPIAIVFWRCVFGAAFMLAWCLAFRYLPDRSLSWRKLGLSAVAGSSLVSSWASFFAGIKMTSIATATIVIHFQPFFIVLIGAVFLKERLSRDQLLWIACAFVGLVFASGIGLSPGAVDHQWIAGVSITMLGALFYAITAILGKRLGTQRSEVTALCQTVMGIVLFAPFVQLNQHISMVSWGCLMGIGVIHSGIAWVVIYSAYPKVSTPVIAVLSFVYPVVAIFIDWVICGHHLGVTQAAGMIVIAIATLGVRLSWRFGGWTRADPLDA